MEREWPVSIKAKNGGTHELNVSISTKYIGLGFRVNIGDFVDCFELNLFALSIFYFRYPGQMEG